MMRFPIGISIFQGSIFQVSWYLLGVVDLDDWLSFLGTNKSLAQHILGIIFLWTKSEKWTYSLKGLFLSCFFPVWLKFDLNCIGGWICFRFWLHHFFNFNVWGIEGKIIKSQHVIGSNHHAWIIEQSGSPAAETLIPTWDIEGFWVVYKTYKNQQGWHGPSSERWLGQHFLQMMHI